MDDRIIQLTSDLVAIPTHETEQEAQELIANWLEGAGFDCELQTVAPGRPNLVALRGGERGVLVNSHVDVHPPHGHADAWVVDRRGNTLVGRGVLDAKGQIAALIAAVEAERSAPACVVITCDEESRGLGSEHVQIPDGPWSRDGGIVLEPTNFRICTAQAGHIDLAVDVSSTPRHAYAPESAGSPVKALLAVIEELDTCSFLKHEHPLVGRPRTNVGVIAGGEHPWRTPARAQLEMTIGVTPGTDFAAAEQEVLTRLEDVAHRWRQRGITFLYEVVDTSEPIDISLDRVPIANQIARAMDVGLAPAGMPSWTDAGNLLLKRDQPCVVFGAGDLGSAHSNHEWVMVDDLVRLARVLRQVLRNSSTIAE